MINSVQYNSFLGGEISPRLQYRTDMEKFGKWFKTAENIRFHTIGSFENRPGFLKIAETRTNNQNDLIKLISFVFNDEQAYLLEFGTGYVRFYKDGKQILVDSDGHKTTDKDHGTPYEVYSPFNLSEDKDFKYAQSGDIVFICNGTDKVQELRRLKDTDTDFQWEFKEFEFTSDCMPLDEENSDESKRIAISSQTTGDFSYPEITFDLDYNRNFPASYNYVVKVKMPAGEETVFTSNVLYPTLNDFANDFTNNNTRGLTCEVRDNHILAFISSNVNRPLSVTLNCTFFSKSIYYLISDTTGSHDYEHVRADRWTTLFLAITGNRYGIDCYLTASDLNDYNTTDAIGAYSLNILNARGDHSVFWRTGHTDNLIRERTDKDYFTLTCCNRVNFSSTKDYKYKTLGYKEYQAVSDFDFFTDKKEGDIFALRNQKASEEYSAIQSDSQNETISDSLLGNGSWRCWTEGNWAGYFKLQYSTDNGESWTTFYEFTCNDNKKPRNVNVTGEIENINDLCLIRAVIKQTSHDTYNMDFDLEHKGSTINSYYKITAIQNDRHALVKCVKNDIKDTNPTHIWREGVFSSVKGYPTCIGFYQNRLFFGKDYILYGSKINDFWDFYEGIELKDDDPVTMSLLSYRVNNIKNIITVRNLFAFTQGGEFGIASEGALTQTNKNLKQFSTHGSADCLPIVVGSIILFVDKSKKKVRAMQYAFESDNYEAEDVSVFIEELLEKENIVSVEYLPNTHESLFLSDTGTIWVFKFFKEQNIFAWTHWKHANGTITNICVVPNGSEDDLYIAVKYLENKFIEKLDDSSFMDNFEVYEGTSLTTINTDFQAFRECVIIEYYNEHNNNYSDKYTIVVPENKQIALKHNCYKVEIGNKYTSKAILLSPEIPTDKIGNNTIYNKKRPFKVHFVYNNSYGFRIGTEDNENMEIQFQDVFETIDAEEKLTSGKKSVLVPSRYNESARVAFVQEEPYPMIIENVNIEVDYGGK